MTEYQQGLMEELRDVLEELNGDILALENFFRCLPDDVKVFGAAATASYLQRIQGYIHQHAKDTEQVTTFLCNDAALKLSHIIEAGQVL